MLFPVCHKNTAKSHRLFYKNDEAPIADGYVFDASMSCRDDAETQRPEFGLRATEFDAGR